MDEIFTPRNVSIILSICTIIASVVIVLGGGLGKVAGQAHQMRDRLEMVDRQADRDAREALGNF